MSPQQQSHNTCFLWMAHFTLHMPFYVTACVCFFCKALVTLMHVHALSALPWGILGVLPQLCERCCYGSAVACICILVSFTSCSAFFFCEQGKEVFILQLWFPGGFWPWSWLSCWCFLCPLELAEFTWWTCENVDVFIISLLSYCPEDFKHLPEKAHLTGWSSI